MVKKIPPRQNRRISTGRPRHDQYLLDVKVRAHKAAAQRTQRVIFVSCILVTVLAVVGGITFGTKNALNALFFKNPDYRVKTIEIVSDGNLTRETILRACNLGEGMNIFSVNLPQVRESLGSLPQIEDSRVERILPDRLIIKVQERRPVAWVVPPETNLASFNFENAYLIDRRGVLLKTKTIAPEYRGLPVISGVKTSNYSPGQALDQDEVRAALDLIRINSEILQTRFQIRSIDVSKGYCLVAIDRQKASVTFNLDNLEWQLRRLALLLDYCEQNSKALQTANLMAERNVPVTFVPEEPPESLDDPEELDQQPEEIIPHAAAKTAGKGTAGRNKTEGRRTKGGTARKAPHVRHAL